MSDTPADESNVLSLGQGAALVQACIEYLEPEYMDEPGVFRVQGSEQEVSACFQDVRAGSYGKLEGANDHNVVACVLKRYFRILAEPILTSRLYDDFIAAVQLPAIEGRVDRIKGLIDRLPEANKKVVSMLVPFLTRCAMRSDKNRMTASQLGVIFGQSLLWPSSLDQSLQDSKKLSNLVTTMIEYSSVIFAVPPAAAATDAVVAAVPAAEDSSAEQRMAPAVPAGVAAIGSQVHTVAAPAQKPVELKLSENALQFRAGGSWSVLQDGSSLMLEQLALKKKQLTKDVRKLELESATLVNMLT